MIDHFTMPENAKRITSADELNFEGCIMLVEEICRLAAADYVSARGALKRTPNDKQAKHNYRIKRDFFLTDYFHRLTGLNGQAVLDRLDRDEDGIWKQRYVKGD